MEKGLDELNRVAEGLVVIASRRRLEAGRRVCGPYVTAAANIVSVSATATTSSCGLSSISSGASLCAGAAWARWRVPKFAVRAVDAEDAGAKDDVPLD